jgi:catechol 2,3-dioxygenase-like lactoylglutathione lyase family enzyme
VRAYAGVRTGSGGGPQPEPGLGWLALPAAWPDGIIPVKADMLQASEVIAFAASADLRQARAFYEQVLGLRVVEQNDFACVFDANGTMLRVTAVAEVARPGYTVLGWRVADIAATVHRLTERGVVFLRYDGLDQDQNGVWTAPGGDMIAWFTDPDGNVLSLTQFA